MQDENQLHTGSTMAITKSVQGETGKLEFEKSCFFFFKYRVCDVLSV